MSEVYETTKSVVQDLSIIVTDHSTQLRYYSTFGIITYYEQIDTFDKIHNIL